MDRAAKLRELAQLRVRVTELETQLDEELWGLASPPNFYVAYHAVAGAVYGMAGALVSLLFNVLGSLLVAQHPLRLIQIYLTFPLGKKALELGAVSGQVRDDVILTLGTCLYLATGMVIGVPFHLILWKLSQGRSWPMRLLIATAMSLSLWILLYYVLLSWLQPLLFEGNWIVSEIPWWVAALTHLTFGWTILLLQPLSQYVPRQPRTEIA